MTTRSAMLLLLAATGCITELDTDELESELHAPWSAKNVASGKCMDVPNASVAAGAAINQFTCHGGANQRFMLLQPVPGIVQLQATHSGLCVTPQGYQGWSTQSMRLVQAACNSGLANWTLENGVNGRFTIRW